MLFLKIFFDKEKELEVHNEEYLSPIPNGFLPRYPIYKSLYKA